MALKALKISGAFEKRAPGVKRFPVEPVPDLNAGITASECMGLHGRKHRAEQCWSKHVAWFDAVGYWEEVCLLATDVRAANLGHDLPEPFSADFVEGLSQVLEGGEEIS